MGGLALAVISASALGLNSGLVEPATAQDEAPRLQPFERPGESFPGSAFYFLEPDSGVIATAPGSASLEAGSPGDAVPLDAALGDAAARPTYLSGSATDRLRALQCLTTAIYYEAATEPDAGQRAVAQVILNRVAHPTYPASVCGVIYQGSDRPGCQFSYACDGSMARSPSRQWWQRAHKVAEAALAGEVYAPVGMATHYHTSAVNPYWASSLSFIGTIGAHRFYRWKGAAGQPRAFTIRYAGGEPTPAPKPRALTPLREPIPDPVALAAAYERAEGAAQKLAAIASPMGLPAAASIPAPMVNDKLPDASGIKPEYRNSGRWIAQPKG